MVALALGCAHYEPKPLSLSDSAASLDRRSLTNSDLQSFVAMHLTNQSSPITNWNIDSLTLAAVFYHPGLQLARAQSQTAAAGKITASARPNPTLSLSPGYDFSAVAPANPWIPGATIDLPIETAGKRGKRQLQAQQLAIAAQLSVVSTAWQIRSNVHAAVIELWSAREREKLLTNQVTHQSALLRLLEQRLAAGAIAANELLPVQVSQVRMQSDLAAARAAAIQAKARLAEAIGIPAANLLEIRIDDPELHIDPSILARISELRSNALQHRSDILVTLARYEAAQAALQLEIAKQYPDVHIGSGYQWDQGDHKWNVLLSFELPVFNRNRGPIAEAEARRTERAVEVIDAQARAINEIDSAVAVIEVARDEMNRAHEALATLEKQSKAVTERLALGGADRTEIETASIEESAAAILSFEANVRAQ
ncbi:MAG TPA: TolC family protein, partial [Verrucomicrobiae bacterium]